MTFFFRNDATLKLMFRLLSIFQAEHRFSVFLSLILVFRVVLICTEFGYFFFGKCNFWVRVHTTPLTTHRSTKYLDRLSVKGSQLGVFSHRSQYTVTKLRCRRNLQLFSNRLKFEPIVLRRKGDGVLLFLKAFLGNRMHD